MHDDDEVYDTIPDSNHVELVMDGLLDSIEGNEGQNLSKAQHYLQGVLYASGSVRTTDIEGNEGFFSSIGDGLKKAWDYVKKMFTWIYNLFFKKENKEQDQKAHDSLDKAEKSIKQVEQAKVPEAKVKETISTIAARITHMPESREKKHLDDKIEAIKTLDSKSAQARELSELLPEVFKVSLLNYDRLLAKQEKINAAVEKLENREAIYKSEGADKEEWAADIRLYLNGLIGLPDAFESVTDLSSAKAWIAKSRRCLQAMNNNLENYRTRESSLKTRISEIESALMAYGKDKKSTRPTPLLDQLKKSLVSVSAIIYTAGQIREAITETGEIISKACVSVL